MEKIKKQFDIYIPEVAVKVGLNVVILKPHGIIRVMDIKNKPNTFRYPNRIINLRIEPCHETRQHFCKNGGYVIHP